MSKIKSGTIIAIHLNHELGFLFAKVVNLTDFSKIDLSKTFHNLIYPYNYIKNDISEFELSEFLNSEPLTAGLYVMDLLPVIKKKHWQVVGDINLRDYERLVPDFRGFSSKVFAVHKYEKDADSWRYYENGRPLKWIIADYEQVKHLEDSQCFSHDIIEIRISMEILNRKGEDVANYYQLKEWKELSPYYNMLFTENFNTVPDDLKCKAIKNKSVT